MGAATVPLPVVATAGRAPSWQVDGVHFVGVDAGCDWQTLDPRFSRCLSCPLDRCRSDMSAGESRLVRATLQARVGPR